MKLNNDYILEYNINSYLHTAHQIWPYWKTTRADINVHLYIILIRLIS